MKVSNSSIQCFKSCRRMYELKYIHGLEPVKTAESLTRGIAYHELIEALLTGADRFDECEDPKIKAMAAAFAVYVMPKMPVVKSVEDWFSYTTESRHVVFGRLDGKAQDGTVIEHKTTSGKLDGGYLQRLDFDEQIPTYLLSSGSNKVFYTVCAVPTIRLKRNETNDEFLQRCIDWFADDTDSKIGGFWLERSDEELSQFAKEQDAVINEMAACENFYRNPGHCMKWGRLCEYAPVCKHYDPKQEYIQFTKRERGVRNEKAGQTED